MALSLRASIFAAIAFLFCTTYAHAQPNIVHIFADDLGWGSVGYNGQSLIKTPNIDALANGGMKFNNAYAATVCGPARAMLVAGYHNGHTLVDSNQNLGGDPYRSEGQTVGQYLQNGGYNTALFGKWGFSGTGGGGDGLKPNPNIVGPNSIPSAQGYETFYGYLNHARAHSYRVDSLWTSEEPLDDNNNGIDEIGEKYASQPATGLGMWLEKTGNNSGNLNASYTADIITQKSLQYITDQASTGQPFYMQYSSTIPHFDIDAIRNQPGWFDEYGDANVPGSDSWTNDQKAYAAMITHFDTAVGEIVDKLRDPNGDGDQSDSILSNTLIMFSSDNGATPEDNSPINFFDASGGKRGGKRDLWDGGINVPTFAYWDGTIAPGQESDRYTDLPDFMPTALELAGVEPRVGLDGVSLVHELTGQGLDRKKNYVVQEHHEGDGPDSDGRNGRWAIIRDDYKLIKFSNGDLELFDLVNDEDENSPLSFSNPTFATIRNELRDIAIAEGAEQPDSYTVEFQDWDGSSSSDFTDSGNWNGTAPGASTPSANWSAVMNNTTASESTISIDSNVQLLALDVEGEGADQTLRLNRKVKLTGRNEVRVSDGGRVNLDDATLSTVRWVDVKQGGELSGHGSVEGDVYNWGAISPGLPDDLGQPSELPPPPEVPQGVDTGVVVAAIFDFSVGDGQDEAPLTATTVQSEYLEVTSGLDFGPGLSPRNAADAGNEFNVQGHQSGTSISSAITAEDYLTYTVDPIFGIEMLVDQVSFDYWRNGTNAARQFGIMTSIDGFTAGDELATSVNHSSGDTNTYTLTANYNGGEWVQGPVEVRFYGWNAGSSFGNTHVNDARMSASFRTISAQTIVDFDFGGQGDGQDEAPLTATNEISDSVDIVAGLQLGSGLSFKGSGSGTNNGDEFDIQGFTNSGNLNGAISADDYITYTVQSIAGLEMEIREVSFEFWRNGTNAPSAFAIMTSLDGFNNGDELGTLGPVPLNDGSAANPSDLIGFDARTTFTADAGGGTWTSDPVEVRLYGWGAGSGGNLHVTDASLTGFFRSIGGQDVALDPTGALNLDGNFYHVDGGMINIDLGGTDQSNVLNPEYDHIIVSQMTELAGDLTIALVDSFIPGLGDQFTLISAAELTGAFDFVNGAALDSTLQWSLSYSATEAILDVIAAGDFNRDGNVDAADYTIWRDTLGQDIAAFTGADADGNGVINQLDYDVWAGNYGFSSANPATASTAAVPEPSAALLLLASITASVFMRNSLAY